MKRALLASLDAWQKYWGNGFYVYLLLAACLYFLVFGRKKERSRILSGYIVVFLAVFFCPVTAYIIQKCIGRSVYWRLLWILPAVPLIAYAGTCLIKKVGASRPRQYILLIFIAAVLAFCGTGLNKDGFYKKVQNVQKIPDEVVSICNLINEQKEENEEIYLATDDKAHSEGAKKILQRLEHEIPPETMVGDLRVGQQQMVEIARNLNQDDLRVLIMDEPTSSLSAAEVKVLFKIMRELLEAGISIVYISHRLEEIMEIGDHVTILRDGKYVADADVKDIELSWIVENMVGKNTQYHRFERSIDLSKQPKVLEIKDMCLPKKGGGWTLDHVSLDLKKGEVLGVYGLLGAGRSELFECLMGLHPEHTGDVLYEGKKLNIKDVAAQIKNGFALVPEDRQSQGLIQTLDIGKNTAISSMKDYVKGLFLDEKAENAAVDEQIKDIHIKVADKRLPILSLSGGNQQKVVIGKGLLTKPKILLLDEPSRGIDIGAKTEVFEIIHDLAEKGLSIIVISSELKEIMAIADRIVVLSNGKKTGELTGDEITEDTLVRTSYAGLGTGRNA